MKKALLYIKNKTAFLGAIIAAAIVGGTASAIVMAAIPDSSGIIHSCYKNSTGMLKVVDSENGGACASGETALNWNQTGPQGPAGTGGAAAYAHIRVGGVLDTSLSKNINSVTEVYSSGFGEDIYCIEASVGVKSISVIPETYLDNMIGSVDVGSQDWINITSNSCPAGTNAVVNAGLNPDNDVYVILQ